MAVTYGFYDSLNHDRLYNAQQMSAIFDGIINDGIFMSVGNQFHTVAGTGMQVIVKSGRAWFDSTWTLNDAEYPLSIDAADVLLTRIDAVVLEVNSEVANRANTIKVVKGTPASTPAKPTLTNTATIHQHALAYVTVAKNITAITNSMIEIVVGKTETPYVTAILQTTDITDLYNQWEDYFQTWFDTVRGTLDGDVALNLQNQITSLRRETLKNTTPPIIGLPASAIPDDMFQALAKTGDLHVWRKTAVTKEPVPEVPGSYTLGSAKQLVVATRNNSVRDNESYIQYLQVGASISVELSGKVTIDSPSTQLLSVYSSNSNNTTPKSRDTVLGSGNKYFCVPEGATVRLLDLNIQYGEIYYIPDGATFTGCNNVYGGEGIFSSAQLVTGIPGTPGIPAGTTTTYPVSTNPNTYQEGSDGKPAGYTLGEVVISKVKLGYSRLTSGMFYHYADTLSVSDDGKVSISTQNSYQVNRNSNTSDLKTTMAGKFIQLYASSGSAIELSGPFSTIPGEIVFIPADTSFNTETIRGDDYFTIDRYQPVTGYAAILASTTIKYLGKLGDKTRVQVVSYVGTGTYGSSNPCSISVNFPMKAIVFLARFYTDNEKKKIANYFTIAEYGKDVSSILVEEVPKTYSQFLGLGNKYYNNNFGKRSNDCKSYYWYNTNNASDQGNSADDIYYFLVIG